MTILYPDLRPSISKARAIVTTKWGKSGYRPIAIRSLEQYYIDTALDSDADTWTLDIGDPTGAYIDLFKRDAEIRVQIFGVGSEGVESMMTGIADDVTFDETGVISFTGRDMSSLAVDSDAPPQQYRHARAWSVIEAQARELGFKNVQLSKAGLIKKLIHTDGSESYWDFWYRLYRNEKMWIWCEPDGTLMADRLNYTGQISYYFGTPKASDSKYVHAIYIPIEHAVYRKTTQQRLGEVWVFGQRGLTGFQVTVEDPTTQGWIKRPKRILLDTQSHTVKGARKMAWEEIFEGKVGSRELTLTIPDPGYMIKQNRIAHVRIPQMEIEGTWYVVGVRAQGTANGFVQEIRLRERQYAITHRIPSDVKLVTHEPKSSDVISSLGQGISALAEMPESWGPYFISAAKEWHGPWDFDLFLAVLLGICAQETNFQNERENGGPGGDHHIWVPPPSLSGLEKATASIPVVGGAAGLVLPALIPKAMKEWITRFANESGDGYVTREFGVGPMQLTSRGVKHSADDHFKAGNRNEWTGGRWHPEHNIWAAAKLLREMLQQVVRDSGRDADIWMGVMAYNRGAQGALDYFAANQKISAYAQNVRKKVNTDPGYLGGVKGAVQAAQEATKAALSSQSDFSAAAASTDGKTVPTGLPTRNQIIVKMSEFRNPFLSPTSFTKRDAIVYAAMWGFYNDVQMHYTQGSQRMKDFDPPPNVPGNTDCSGFATWCYKSGQAIDPNGLNYNGTGYTGTLWSNGQNITFAQIQKGDLVFYGNPQSPNGHVAVYVGFGFVVSFGSEEGPYIWPVNYRSDLYGFRTYNLN